MILFFIFLYMVAPEQAVDWRFGEKRLGASLGARVEVDRKNNTVLWLRLRNESESDLTFVGYQGGKIAKTKVFNAEGIPVEMTDLGKARENYQGEGGEVIRIAPQQTKDLRLQLSDFYDLDPQQKYSVEASISLTVGSTKNIQLNSGQSYPFQGFKTTDSRQALVISNNHIVSMVGNPENWEALAMSLKKKREEEHLDKVTPEKRKAPLSPEKLPAREGPQRQLNWIILVGLISAFLMVVFVFRWMR